MKSKMFVAIAALAAGIASGAQISDYSEGADVIIGNGESLTVTDSDMATLNAFNSFTIGSGGTVTFNLADDADLSCVSTNKGTIVKTGAGALKLTYIDLNSFESGAIDIREGEFWGPQTFAYQAEYFIGKVTVASNAVFVTPRSTLSNGACNVHVNGLWGDGVVTNLSASGSVQLRIVHYGTSPSVFGGRIVGTGLRYYTGGNVWLTGTNSNFSGTFQVYKSAADSAFTRYGVTGVMKIGNSGEESSCGRSNELASRERGACILYLGEGETTAKPYHYYNNQDTGMHMWDAGAHGGITFTGLWNHNNSRAERLILTGSNTAPCVVSGAWSGDDSAPTYVIKRGTGTWTMAHNSSRSNQGVFAVEEGTLRFASIAETNVVCSLGLATKLQSSYSGTYDASKNVDYAYLLGTATTRGMMEYIGSNPVSVSTRHIAVNGEGGLRLGEESAGKIFRFSGASALADGSTLVLSGAEGTSGHLLDAEDGAGTLGVSKEGEGSWRLVSNCDDLSGDVSVKEGTLEVVGIYTNDFRWYQFVIRGIVNDYTGANDQNICFAGIRFYGEDGAVLTSSSNMSFVQGAAHATVSDGRYALSNATSLASGEYAWTDRSGYYKYYTTRDIDKMFDLDTSDSRICVYWISPYRNLSTSSTWGRITMHMPDGMARAAAFDVRSNQSGSNGRSLSDWTLYGSDDGVRWEELTRYDYSSNTIPANANRWFSDPSDTSDKNAARPGAGYSIIKTYANHPLANVASLSVSSNATLKAIGYVELGRLTVDASDAGGNGTVDGFDFAESGTLDLTGLEFFSGRKLIPFALTNCTDVANIGKWQVQLDGESTARYRASASSEGISVFSVGTTLLLR